MVVDFQGNSCHKSHNKLRTEANIFFESMLAIHSLIQSMLVPARLRQAPKRDGKFSHIIPDAPCREYLPTLGEKWPHSRGNVGKYSIHGAFGNLFSGTNF